MFLMFSVTKQTVALKEIRLQPEEGAPFTAIREGTMNWLSLSFNYITHSTTIIFSFSASLLQELKHANVVKLHDIVHTRDTLMFVFEYLVSLTFISGWPEAPMYLQGGCPPPLPPLACGKGGSFSTTVSVGLKIIYYIMINKNFSSTQILVITWKNIPVVFTHTMQRCSAFFCSSTTVFF